MSAWIGTATTSLARRRRDLGGAREARTHVGHRLVDRDDDLEVGRLPLPGVGVAPVVWIGLLPISVTWPLNVLSATASIVTTATCPIVTFGMSVSSTSIFRLDDRHVGDRQQHGAGVVHRADHDVLAFLDVAPGDDAVHRRRDRHLAQVVARGRETRLLLLDLLLARLHFLLARLQLGLADRHVVLRPLERFARREAVLGRGPAGA